MTREVAAFRGSVLRSYVESLREEGMLERVVAQLDDEARALVEMPPTSSELVPARVTNHVLEAYDALRGLDAVRDLAKRANRAGIVRILEPVLRTAMRIGGASPGAILSRLELILRQQQRGYELGWEQVGPTSGRVRIVSNGLRETTASLASWEGALSIAFDLTGTPGSIRTESRRFVDEQSLSTLLASW